MMKKSEMWREELENIDECEDKSENQYVTKKMNISVKKSVDNLDTAHGGDT